jgi:threonine dehydratase
MLPRCSLVPCRARRVNVSEQEIADAMLSLLHHHSKLVEGAAGCALAAFWQQRARLRGARAVVLCCGGNVSASVVTDVLRRGRVLPGGPAAGGPPGGGDPLGPAPRSLPRSG